MTNKARLMRLKEIVNKMSLEEKADLCSGADFWHTEAIARLGIDSILMTDGPHGLRRENEAGSEHSTEPATCFPTASALACSFDRGLAKELGSAIAVEARDQGISLVLGPGVNIKRSPLCGRNFEYFSEDPFLSGEMAAAQINGMQETGAGACIKHYAVNSQENKRFVSDSCVDSRALHEIYLEAFRIAIEKSRPFAVMSSYNRVNGKYAGESEYLIDEVLRGKFEFDGAVISDWGAVCDRAEGIKAGLDLEMPGKTSGTSLDIIDAIEKGTLDESSLDDTVARILDLVTRCKNAKGTLKLADYEANHELARRAASESAVLLKNDDNLLPFDDGKPFAVIGRFAKYPRYQGSGSSRISPRKLPSVLDELKARGLDCPYSEGYNEDGSTNDVIIGDAKQIAAETGRAVIFAGLPESFESEGFDREQFGMPDGMLKLIDVVSAECSDTVVYLMLGSPVALPFADRVKTIVCGYLGGQASGPAAVDIITGRTAPGGRLAESWPLKLADVPCAKYYGKNRKVAEYREGIYVGYRYYNAAGVEPRYAFGHGRSYTDFSFGGISCDRKTLGSSETATVSVRVSNTGTRDGSAVVQYYTSKKDSVMLELKGFEKIHLFAGESRIVSCEFSADSFSYHNSDIDERCIEMGDYTIHVAAASDDIKGFVDLTVWPDDSVDIPPYFDAQSAADLDDKTFFDTLGYVPKEPPKRPFTLNSTLGELRTRTVGKILNNALENQLHSSGVLSQGMVELALKSFEDLPIRVMCANSRGMLKKTTAQAVIHFANNKFMRGVIFAIKK